jgi:3-hydroxyanthranilate 3,4-dioxygenase
MERPINSSEWIDANRESFSPPISNKLLYRNGLSVMFVGGPNSRTDFHLDESSEFFYQIKGNMHLPIIEQGKRKLVEIKQGQVFLLPSRIPHSPQRPEAGSLGLVIERKRDIGKEFDALRWYTDFNTCDQIQYEQSFTCLDLGKDLVPVVADYRRFLSEGRTFVACSSPRITEDEVSVIPDPFSLSGWLEAHKEELRRGTTLPLFGDSHPDKEFRITVTSQTDLTIGPCSFEAFLFQLNGLTEIVHNGAQMSLTESSCFVLAEGSVCVLRNNSKDSRTLILHCDPRGNKQGN